MLCDLRKVHAHTDIRKLQDPGQDPEQLLALPAVLM